MRFGVALARRIKQYINARGAALDVGSSAGGVLHGFRLVFPDLEVIGVESSLAESAYTEERGIPTRPLLFEDFIREDERIFATIMCVRSLNHLLDPRRFFQWSYEHLEDNGRLILAVKNFRHQVRRAGSIAAGVQIDHPFLFVPEALKQFVESIGFIVTYFDVDEDKPSSELKRQRKEGFSVHHMRLVCEKKGGANVSDAPQGDAHIPLRLRMQFSRWQFGCIILFFICIEQLFCGDFLRPQRGFTLFYKI